MRLGGVHNFLNWEPRDRDFSWAGASRSFSGMPEY
jgi:hypothetical protein